MLIRPEAEKHNGAGLKIYPFDVSQLASDVKSGTKTGHLWDLLWSEGLCLEIITTAQNVNP